jgi:hypothetical protein
MLFCLKPTRGRIRKKPKYDVVTNTAVSIKGLSTISCPIQPRQHEVPRKNQNSDRLIALK